MSENINDKLKWNALACPACRLVFRVPNGHQGIGVICPDCHNLLSIPSDIKKADPAELKSQLAQGAESAKNTSTKKEVLIPKRIAILGSVFALVAILFAVSLFDSNSPALKPAAQTPGPEPLPALIEDTDNKPESSEQIALAKLIINLNKQEKEKFSAIIQKFLDVKQPSEFEPMIINSKKNMSILTDYYAHTPLSPSVIDEVKLSKKAYQKGDRFTLKIQERGKPDHTIIIIKSGDNYKVDWKHWVKWSEYSWEQMLKKKPTQPFEIRVTCQKGFFYNRDFKDEDKYLCLRLEDPQSSNTVHAYISRENAAYSDISLLLKKHIPKPFAATLKIRYPENAQVNNQVLISQLISENWNDSFDQ